MPDSMFKMPGGRLLHQRKREKLSLCQNRDLFMPERIVHHIEKTEWMLARTNTEQSSQPGCSSMHHTRLSSDETAAAFCGFYFKGRRDNSRVNVSQKSICCGQAAADNVLKYNILWLSS